MFTCPQCSVTLSKRMSPSLGLTWVCPSCRGRAVTLDLLRRVVPQPLVNRLWQRARSGPYGSTQKCPACNRRMAEVPIIATEGKTTCLDVCTHCHFVWFDTQEFEGLPKIPPELPKSEALPLKAREALALAHLEALRRESAATDLQAPPDHWWQLVVGILGMPVEYNDTPLRSWPLVTWSLAAAIATVSLVARGNLDAVIWQWGLIPAELGRYFGLTFLTSFFLHGGLFHLLINLYFLVVFGDNTEDVLGKDRFLLLVATAAVAGDITHILADPRASLPCVGASGAISGILAYYCLRFPTANVGFLNPFHYYRANWFLYFRAPVIFMLVAWASIQILEIPWIMGGIGNVAVFAHLGGAAVGVLFWWWTRRTVSAGAPQAEAS